MRLNLMRCDFQHNGLVCAEAEVLKSARVDFGMEAFCHSYLSAAPVHETSILNGEEAGTFNWPASESKRAFDFVVALAALVFLFPIILLAAVAVKLSSPGPVLFKQRRAGIGGTTFTIYKFRSMRVPTEGHSGPFVTKTGDSRLTAAGAVMRRWKIDELPQLWNVVRGEMSLVGARPKVPTHQVFPLEYRPGITGAASLAFRDEEGILSQVCETVLDDYQIHVMMPLKFEIDRNYMRHATFLSDLRIIFATVLGRGEKIAREDLSRFESSLLALDWRLKGRFENRSKPVYAAELSRSMTT